MLAIEKTELDGVLLIKPEVFEDFRGTYTETYNKKLYQDIGIPVEFVCDDYSTSKKDVLRGLHGDKKTYKLVSCMRGEFFLAVVNCDKNSSQYGRSVTFNLSEKNKWQVLIPPKFGNGHLALTDWIVFNYKQSEYYNRESQFSLRYDDPTLSIPWPIKNPILSDRDKNAVSFKDINV